MKPDCNYLLDSFDYFRCYVIKSLTEIQSDRFMIALGKIEILSFIFNLIITNKLRRLENRRAVYII
jgi:hypothetical protein